MDHAKLYLIRNGRAMGLIIIATVSDDIFTGFFMIPPPPNALR